MNTCNISVIIPTYNRSQQLLEAIAFLKKVVNTGQEWRSLPMVTLGNLETLSQIMLRDRFNWHFVRRARSPDPRDW